MSGSGSGSNDTPRVMPIISITVPDGTSSSPSITDQPEGTAVPTSDICGSVQQARDSAYYATIPWNRVQHSVTPEEVEFGWGGSARHFRQSRVTPKRSASHGSSTSSASPTSPSSPTTPWSPATEESDASALESSFEDSDDSEHEPDVSFSSSFYESAAEQDGSPQRSVNWWKRFLRRMRLEGGAVTDKTPDLAQLQPTSERVAKPASEPVVDPVEAARLRQQRDEFLQKRKARGSIFYDGRTAQIPLFAAPKAANIADAPALSSFAPLAPIGQKSRTTPSRLSVMPDASSESRPNAQAIATMDCDGNIIGIRRNKSQTAWSRNQRFSRYIATSPTDQQDLPPVPPVPALIPQSCAGAAHKPHEDLTPGAAL